MAARSSAAQETSRQYLPVLLLLFVGSGCAALIYEIVWFQLLQLVIGSSAVSLGVLLGHVHGRHVPRQPAAAALRRRRPAPAARVRGARARHRRDGPAAAVRHAARRRASTPRWADRDSSGFVAARAGRRHLPAAADAHDGRDAAGDRALGRDDARRRVVARLLLRRQHRRRGVRQPARRLLPAARVRHGRSRRSSRSRSTSSVASLGAAAREDARRYEPSDGGVGAGRSRAPGSRRSTSPIALSGHDGARGGSDLDAPAVAAVRRDGLHVLADPRGVPGRPRHRQQHRRDARARSVAAARGARLVPDAAVRRDGVGGLSARRSRCRTGRSTRRSLDRSPWFNFQLDLVRCFWVVLPGAILWGASFPLALASVAEPGQDPARLVGGVYAANTVGAIVGSLGGQPAARRRGSARSTRSSC